MQIDAFLRGARYALSRERVVGVVGLAGGACGYGVNACGGCDVGHGELAAVLLARDFKECVIAHVVHVHRLVLAGCGRGADAEHEVHVVGGRGHRVGLAEPLLAVGVLGGGDALSRPCGGVVAASPRVEVDVVCPACCIGVHADGDVLGLKLRDGVVAGLHSAHLAAYEQCCFEHGFAQRDGDFRARGGFGR